MFESAIEAATTAARTWQPAPGDPAGDSTCCGLCLRRYRRLLLDGPLQGLPHAVAHAAVLAVDDRVGREVEAAVEDLRWSTWITLASEGDRELELQQRLQEASSELVDAACTELSRAEWRFAELRHRFTEPAIEMYLTTHRMNEVPWQWDL